MRNIRSPIICLAIVALSISVQTQALASKTYVCPMFCEKKLYNEPGVCSVCRMALIEKTDNAETPPTSQSEGYVCPPCGAGCDNTVHQKPGTCSECGMALVKKSSLTDNSRPNRPPAQFVAASEKKVAIFIFEGVQIIDYTGPYEVFGQAGFQVFTVAEKAGALTTAMGMSVNPKYTFENHPKPDILLIPGGGVTRHQNNPQVIKWIQDNAQQSEVVLSVCNGAYLLAKAGLLDGLEATTFASLIPGLQAAAPKANVVSDKRFVDNGKIITSAGLSSGIDGALHVVEKVLGKGWAQSVATNLEYDWDPESKYVRAALADKYLTNAYQIMRGFERELLRHEGNLDHWTTAWKIKTEMSVPEVFDEINKNLVVAAQWARQPDDKTQGKTSSFWKFTDPAGNAWHGAAKVQAIKGEQNSLNVTMSITRDATTAKK